jgi:hypothetical protein
MAPKRATARPSSASLMVSPPTFAATWSVVTGCSQADSATDKAATIKKDAYWVLIGTPDIHRMPGMVRDSAALGKVPDSPHGIFSKEKTIHAVIQNYYHRLD